MGLASDLELTKKAFQSPLLLLLGQLLQYIVMPLSAIILVYAFNMNNMEALGTFLYGISPGGGISNWAAMYTDSNLELSIALSLISNILSFGLMPMWLALYPYLSPDPSDDGIRLSFHMTYT